LGVRTSFLASLKADFRGRPVAKWFLRRRDAAPKRHSFFHWIFASIGVDQFHFTRHNVRAVLDSFDSHHNAPNLTLSARTASRSSETPSMRPGSISLGKGRSPNSGERTLSVCRSLHPVDELLFDSELPGRDEGRQQFAIAECERQHARGVRSRERSLRRCELNGSFAAHENFARSHSHARHPGARASAIAKAPLQVRGHDKT